MDEAGKKRFFDELRHSGLNLTLQNVFGTNQILAYADMNRTKQTELPYILATAWWETGQTMTPVREANWIPNAEAWRKRHLRYWPWYGRGLIQTTWEQNYRKMSKYVGVDLIEDPDALLTWKAALPALFIGMEKGLYTGKALSDSIDDIDESDSEDLREYIKARNIVNGTDKAKTIGGVALIMERALKKGKYSSDWK